MHSIDLIAENCQGHRSAGCLKLEERMKTWFKARVHCQVQGGDLFYLKMGEHLNNTMLLSHDIIAYENINLHIGMRRNIWRWTGIYLKYLSTDAS